ncbi:hypothetical protein VTK73DRAFT_1796 [Phialemonium thermophilum]|uniref:Uncharacterized protein n=1 Tax=Phialemonium thermophilum TaxID=223376 RepID=A0ABR3VSZ9_9PEZI
MDISQPAADHSLASSSQFFPLGFPLGSIFSYFSLDLPLAPFAAAKSSTKTLPSLLSADSPFLTLTLALSTELGLGANSSLALLRAWRCDTRRLSTSSQLSLPVLPASARLSASLLVTSWPTTTTAATVPPAREPPWATRARRPSPSTARTAPSTPSAPPS